MIDTCMKSFKQYREEEIFTQLPEEMRKQLRQCLAIIVDMTPAEVADSKAILIDMKKALDEKFAGVN
mgnify:CR=1 FL=1